MGQLFVQSFILLGVAYACGVFVGRRWHMAAPASASATGATLQASISAAHAAVPARADEGRAEAAKATGATPASRASAKAKSKPQK